MQAAKKLFKADAECVGSFVFQVGGELFKEFKAPELADVIKHQRAGIEVDDGARMFPCHAIPEQPARHAEVHIEDAPVELDEDLLALAADGLDGAASQKIGGAGQTAASNQMGVTAGVENSTPWQRSLQGADNGFYFGQFWHGTRRRKLLTGSLCKYGAAFYTYTVGVEAVHDLKFGYV